MGLPYSPSAALKVNPSIHVLPPSPLLGTESRVKVESHFSYHQGQQKPTSELQLHQWGFVDMWHSLLQSCCQCTLSPSGHSLTAAHLAPDSMVCAYPIPEIHYLCIQESCGGKKENNDGREIITENENLFLEDRM